MESNKKIEVTVQQPIGGGKWGNCDKFSVYVKKRKMEKKNIPIAVSSEEYESSGCPYCGCYPGRLVMDSRDLVKEITPTSIFICNESKCKKIYIVLANDVIKSSFEFSDCYPELQEHPRKGRPRHEK
jgi:hypothetical protein